MTPAVIVFFIGSYMTASSRRRRPAAAVVGRLLPGVRLAELWGVELSFRVSVLVTLLALGVLVVFWISAIPSRLRRWALNIGVGPDGAR